MSFYEDLLSKKERISIIGLGYVGLPLSVSFSKRLDVIGFDINEEKIQLYKGGIDPTREVGNDIIKGADVFFTTDERELSKAKLHIIAIPTPINPDKTPNLDPLINASRIIGRNLARGSIIVYESTVYPGVTEEICMPVIEKESGFKCGDDFKIGYSPERINPGDKLHRLDNIAKIVSGMDDETCDIIAQVYELVVDKALVYKAESIKIAEAAKVIENAQRDINIAFVNELAIIFSKLGIDTKSVLKAAGTKWNFLNFLPGLVGGHCIGVDPYYLTYRATQLGYHSQIIASGRRINDSMSDYIVECLIKVMIRESINVSGARVAVLGVTFKENCPDTRNSKVVDIVTKLKEYSITPLIVDPVADARETYEQHGIIISAFDEVVDMDAVIIAVGHNEYLNLSTDNLDKFYKKGRNGKKVLFDIKGIYEKDEYEKAGYAYWRL